MPSRRGHVKSVSVPKKTKSNTKQKKHAPRKGKQANKNSFLKKAGLRQLLPALHTITNMNENERRQLLPHFSGKIFNGLTETILNTFHNSSLSPEQRQHIKSSLALDQHSLDHLRRAMKSLACRPGRCEAEIHANISPSLKQKRRRFILQLGAGLGPTLHVGVPLLSQFVQ